MKTGILLLNLGAPIDKKAVRGFLFRLFADPAVLCLPFGVRHLLAFIISTARARKAASIYDKIGGGSPLLKNTEAQAQALEQALTEFGEVKCFIAMRHAPPFTKEAWKKLCDFKADGVVVLPLYPQYSTTTTGSSLKEIEACAQTKPLACQPIIIKDYPTQRGFIEALVEETKPLLKEAARFGKPRLLISAHGLPESIVKAGDPYPSHCEQTAEAFKQALGGEAEDALLCYQSKVGPVPWIAPHTDEEIERAAKEGRPIVVVPIAFVSDHSETLVELGMEGAEIARRNGAPFYAVAKAVGVNKSFIEGLASLVREALTQKNR